MKNIYFYGAGYVLLRWRIFIFTVQDIYFYGEESLLLRCRIFTFTKMSDYNRKKGHSQIYSKTCAEKIRKVKVELVKHLPKLHAGFHAGFHARFNLTFVPTRRKFSRALVFTSASFHAGGLLGWLIFCLPRWSAGGISGGWRAGWLAAGWLAGWLVGWLAGWLLPLAVSGGPGCPWRSLAALGCPWRPLAALGDPWWFLAASGGLWRSLAASGGLGLIF